ncbi:MAG: ATP-binding cassette domain-containing protein [Bacteroidales bacterium]|nr:ATP-binding cassette domain-containing protein [Bacteroidales bacterium]
MNTLISLIHPVPRMSEFRFKTPIMWNINKGEQWAIVGANGSGKSLLANMIQGRIALRDLDGEIKYNFTEPLFEAIRTIAFKDIYTMVDGTTAYYQQRWHSQDAEGVVTVKEILQPIASLSEIEQLFEMLNLTDILDKSIIFLSSGELRKFLLIKVILTHPKLLIVDNPYIGLDSSSRKSLDAMFSSMAKINGMQLLLLLSNPADVPEIVTHVMPVKDMECMGARTRQEFIADTALHTQLFNYSSVEPLLPEKLREASEHQVTFRMEDVNIVCGNRTILKNIDWEVKNGEKWALTGPNGSGKSTLLSLVYADNPKSYSNTLYLFDRKRGTGESIWDIKSRIGYVSPEMHLYFMEDIPLLRIVASGFFDSIGVFRKCTPEQETIAMEWIKCFGIEDIAHRSFLSLSSGEQRLALLARAFVKDPDLIILDEPLHGLDVANKERASKIIESFCDRKGKTLVYVTHYTHEIPQAVTKEFKLIKH